VLRALLPEAGSDIKGYMRSEAELRAVSGYAARPRDFDELLRVLDGELRLLTPTDPEGEQSADGLAAANPPASAQRYFQLTHDYLVQSLEQWLTRKQKETRRGRAELQLAERAALWISKPLPRHLPSPWEWLCIRLFTRSRQWTPPQRKMMRRTDAYYLIRCFAVLGVLGLVAWGGWEYTERLQAQAQRERLLSADMAEVPALLAELEVHRGRVEPLLREALARESDAKKKLLLSLALVRSDRDQVKFLYEQLLHAAPQDFAVIRQVLAPFQEDIRADLWQELAVREPNSSRRFRAACALIDYARDDSRWAPCASLVVDGLVAESPLALIYWKSALAPVKERLLAALAVSLEDSKWSPAERRAITEFYGVLGDRDPAALRPLQAQLHKERPWIGVELARRKATLLASLATLGNPEGVWPLLVHIPNPTLRSYLIERLGSSGIDPRVLKNRLDTETDASARRALILTLGAFPSDRLPEVRPWLISVYTNDPDGGIHGAAGWVLRQWKQEETLAKIDDELATGQAEAGRQWYITGQGQTLNILKTPRPLIAGREEKPGATVATHAFALAATEVTLKQFRAFRKNHAVDEAMVTTVDSPVHKVSWYDAAEYCNWLSQHEEFPQEHWCFQRRDGKLEIAPNYLERRGYRLPTEAEWEFACRAGAETLWCFGEADEELVGRCAWWLGNSHANGVRRCFPVASLKPNDWGLFDMHGNVAEWCLESARAQQGNWNDDIECAYRGGTYLSTYRNVGCDSRSVFGRKMSSTSIGFRVARSLP
jgi:hypothetical protein